MLEGRLFTLDHAGGQLSIHGHPLLVTEQPNSGLGTGLTVWDGSVVLAKFLEARFPTLAGKRVLELGSGPGLAGLAAVALGGKVTFTDLPYALPNLRSVVAANTHLVKAGAQPTVGELDWTGLFATAASRPSAGSKSPGQRPRETTCPLRTGLRSTRRSSWKRSQRTTLTVRWTLISRAGLRPGSSSRSN